MFLQEAPSTVDLVAPGWCHYANAQGTATFTGPEWLTSRLLTTLCDSSYIALIFRDGLALFSVYLPDRGKVERQYESALAELAVAMRLARSAYSVRHFVLVGDWNVQLSRPSVIEDELNLEWGESVFGPNLPETADRRHCDRQDSVHSFCSQFNLVHGPSHLASPRWSAA